MTAPSYTEDLNDISTAESVTSWAEFTGNSYNGQGNDAADGDYAYIEGNLAITQLCTKDTTVGSEAYDYGSGTGGHGTDGAYFVWQLYGVNLNFGTYAQGGFRIVVGNSLANFKAWYVGGNDKPPYPYGGWTCNVANTTVTQDDITSPAPSTTEQYIGSAVYVLTGSSKGSPHGVDVMRFGRGSSIFEYGDGTNGYATIAGFAALNDASTARWGLIQETSGGYLYQGKMTLGTASNAVDFRDSDKNIFIKWTPKVTANFNTIEVNNASSNIEMTGFTFQVLDTSTASLGRWITNADATVVLTSCTFIDMNTFVFDSNTTVNGGEFRRCGLITQAGSDWDKIKFNKPSGSVGCKIDDADNIDDCDWISDGTGYAIELDSSMAGSSYTMSGCTWTGYAATDGSTGNECIYNNITGADVTISVGAGQQPTVHDAATSTTIIQSSVPLYVLVLDADGDPVQNAQVYIATASGGTQIVNQDTDINGEVDTSYSGSTPQACIVWIRKQSSADTPKYKAYSSEQTIASITGLSLAVTLFEDPNNNATT